MTTPTVEQEQRALKRLAADAWIAAARKCGNPYTDRQALSLVRQQALEALRDEDGATILRAIVQRMDRESSPRRIPEWARLQGSDERAGFHDVLKQAERAQRTKIVEHEGSLYFGHVPHAVGDRCIECGGKLKDHRMATRADLPHIGGFVRTYTAALKP